MSIQDYQIMEVSGKCILLVSLKERLEGQAKTVERPVILTVADKKSKTLGIEEIKTIGGTI
jgi:hypothetical protein